MNAVRLLLALSTAALGVVLAAQPASAAPALVEVGSFDTPVYVTAAPGDSSRLFVVERGGRVMMVKDGTVATAPFLDISSIVDTTGEGGLTTIAFSPDYASTGKLYAFYTDSVGIRIAEFVASSPDGVSASDGRIVLTEPHSPTRFHISGQLQFGPDGYLYVSIGDGGDAGDNALSAGSVRGKLLRIDPTPGGGAAYGIPSDNPFAGVLGARPEIWAYGLRNAWRFSFDRQTGDLVLGDVGQHRADEVDFAPRAAGGGRAANLGWNCFEGREPYLPRDVVRNEVLNPSFEIGTGNWSAAGGGALSRAAGGARYGDSAARVAGTTSGNWRILADAASGADVSAGDRVFLRASIKRLTGPDPAGVLLVARWHDASGGLVSTAQVGSRVGTTLGAWHDVAGEIVAPSGVAFASLQVQFSGAAATNDFRVDGAQVLRLASGEGQPAYLDGSLPSGRWEGAAHESRTLTLAARCAFAPGALLVRNEVLNPSFETGTARWALWGGPILGRSPGGRYGGHAGSLTGTASGNWVIYGPSASGADVAPGDRVFLRVSIKRVAGPEPVNVALVARWHTATSGFLGGTTLTRRVGTTLGAWHELAGELVAPAGAAFASVQLQFTGSAATNVFHVDGAQVLRLAPGEAQPPYLDGSLPNGHWQHAAHDSRTVQPLLSAAGALRNETLNPSFETGTAHWAPWGGVQLSRASSGARYGSNALRLTGASGGNWVTFSDAASGADVVAGDRAFLRVSIKRFAGPEPTAVALVARWHTATGGFLGGTTVTRRVGTTPGSWHELAGELVAPSGAAFASVQVQFTGAAAGSEFHLDGAQTLRLAPAETPPAYLDGSLPNARWEGAPHDSRSLEGGGSGPSPDHVPPVLERLLPAEGVDGWCHHSITGGYVVRDPDLPSLNGRYVYGDFCRGEVRSVVLAAPTASDDRATGLTLPPLSLVSFGEDAAGRVYVVSMAGPVYRLSETTSP